MSKSDFPPAVRRALTARSGGYCEGCGRELAAEKHHRQYRSRGGSNLVENGLDLCGLGNTSGCHGVAHSKEGERRGWNIRSGFDPAKVPALITVGGIRFWARLTPGGQRIPIGADQARRMLEAIGVIP